jgi:Hemerythrin HHE cation binding domain
MSTTQPIDVRDMAIVHRTFRNVYKESAQLVRAAPTPSPGRVTFLADHIDFGIAALHHHHEDEDELLYPEGRPARGGDVHAARVGRHG